MRAVRAAQARAVAMAVDDMWEHDLYGGAAGGAVNVVGKLNLETGAKLLINNLHAAVSTQDIKARRRVAARGA
jgi:hypothetical protein